MNTLPLEADTTAPIATALIAQDVAVEQRVHHPYSPSTLEMLEACSCWRSKTSTNARAIAGTLGHKVIETGEDDSRLSDEDAVAAAECLDFVESRRKVIAQGRELKENYLPIDDCVFADAQATTAGYVDHVLVSDDETSAEIIDWKFGRWEVEKAEDNIQGIAYALGLFKKFPTVQQVRVWFKQPHLNYLTDFIFTRAMIPALYLRVQAVVARARAARAANDFKSATPHVPACNFCENLGKCPVGLAYALKVSKKFMPLDFPSDISPSHVLDPQNTKLALNLASVMKVWSESFRRQVTDRVLRRDAPLPEGMMIQKMPGRRQIVDMAKFREVTLRYLTEKDYTECLDASFGPLEERISGAAARGNKKVTLEAYQKDLEDSGAVTRGDGFSFLKIRSVKVDK